MKKNTIKRQQMLPVPLFDTLEHIKSNSHSLPNHANVLNSTPHAQQDYSYSLRFLHNYRGNEATFNAYRRELERLLQWSWLIAQKNIATLKREDIEKFIEFCQHPPIHWISVRQENRFIEQEGQRIPNPEWRPFKMNISKKAQRLGAEVDTKYYNLSQNAVQAVFSILSSFYEYLVQEEYCHINPISQIRQKSKYLRKQQTQQAVRRLSELQWSYVIETAEQMAKSNPEQHERTLFIMTALFAMYLRISELTVTTRWSPKMGDFVLNADGCWWFNTVGKGNKQRQISVSDAMLKALQRYRRSLNLSSLPAIAETTPLILNSRTRGPMTSTRQIRNIVQNCFDQAILRLQTDGFHDEADRLISATVHWLRHTGISEDVKIRPREHVRDDAGHSSSAITDRYVDIELRQRHASAKKKPVKLLDEEEV